ncbi:unnamed protein product [Onchocerca flexuosa]|uniref:Chitin binding Peritrophin-A domain protein n=1 Tax=Onchocerca flexuosa TaxID=387005 RepID=A0A183HDK8_9BILA|nr:unnamed protein product [Onchocerca flexuosa]
MNCTGKKNGDYSMIERKCSKYFWRCSAGETTRRICRGELFFNTVTGKCDTANNIADCADESLIFNCFDYRNSLIARNAIHCPEGQEYDVKQKQCHVAHVAENNSPSSITSFSTQIEKIVSAPELNNFCERSGDGLFSAGCENYFYFCASGFGYHVKCPEGLFFDSKTKNCSYKEHVPSCNLTSKNSKIIANDYTTTPASIDQDESDENRETKEAGLPALVNAPISKKKLHLLLPENFDCRLKADGFYSIGCKTEFVVCANHRMFFFECPHNLIFNEEKQSCDYPENIKNCSESLSKMTDIDELVQDIFNFLI